MIVATKNSKPSLPCLSEDRKSVILKTRNCFGETFFIDLLFHRHSEPFACHSERSEESALLRSRVNSAKDLVFEILRQKTPQNDVKTYKYCLCLPLKKGILNQLKIKGANL